MLTDEERTAHLLATLGEEGGEVSQMVGKCLRFGLMDKHPKTGNIPNLELLAHEVNDLIGVAEMLGIYRDEMLVQDKKARVLKYMDYAERTLAKQKESGYVHPERD